MTKLTILQAMEENLQNTRVLNPEEIGEVQEEEREEHKCTISPSRNAVQNVKCSQYKTTTQRNTGSRENHY